ncbi:OadG family protein [Enterococcus sp. LJL90]
MNLLHGLEITLVSMLVVFGILAALWGGIYLMHKLIGED